MKRLRLAHDAALVVLFSLPLAAQAEVTYSYSDKLFSDGHADVGFEGDTPEATAANNAAAEAALRADRIRISFVTPVYLGAGWNSFSTTGAYAGGDAVLSFDAGRHYHDTRQAATATPGTWTVSGTPVSAVPEASSGMMLLAGLSALAGLRRRRA